MKDLLVFVLILAAMFFFMPLGILAMIGALVGLVIAHEFGHWIVARLCGFEVPTFSVGMGSAPRLLLGKFWGTEFQMTPWLLGGYVAINPSDEQFATAPAWKRAAVLVAGVVMNVIVAMAIVFGLFAFQGEQQVELKNLAVSQLDSKVTIARDAGMQPGDKIVTMDGQAVSSFDQFRGYLATHKGVKLSLGVERAGETLQIDVTPNAEGRIGFMPTGDVSVSYKPVGVFQAAQRSVQLVIDSTFAMGKGLLMMVGLMPTPEALPEGAADVHGVVAIVQIGSTAFQNGFYSFAMMVALISLNLAFFNILPIPLLDGGHLLFIGIEKVTGRRVGPEIQGVISLVFLVLLLSLTAFGLFNDIFHPIKFK